MKDFDSLADEDWRIIVDEYDINEPFIGYPDPDRRGCFVGPLVKVNVGATIQSEEGIEVLELDGCDGRNLFAVACLPQLADLMRWTKQAMQKLNSVHFDSQHECGQFMQELRERVAWVEDCINARDTEIGNTGGGSVGFERFQGRNNINN